MPDTYTASDGTVRDQIGVLVTTGVMDAPAGREAIGVYEGDVAMFDAGDLTYIGNDGYPRTTLLVFYPGEATYLDSAGIPRDTLMIGYLLPSSFGSGDWSIADAGTGGEAVITITTLPSDGGSVITAIEYRIDGGDWLAMPGTGTGARTVGGFTDDVIAGVTIRAVNAGGVGAVGPNKAVTTTGP